MFYRLDNHVILETPDKGGREHDRSGTATGDVPNDGPEAPTNH